MADDQDQALPTDPDADTGSQNVFGAPANESVDRSQLGGVPTTTGSAMGQPSGAENAMTGGPQGGAQKLQDYITGKGAMPKQQWEAAKQKIDPQGTMDQNDLTVAMINQYGPPAVQSARQHWDAYRGAAAKAIGEGNLQLAASEGSKGLQYVPDGTKTMLSATKDGFMASVHTPDGQNQSYDLNPDEAKQFFTGAHGLFDHVTGEGINGVLDSITRAKNPQGAFSGPPAGTQTNSKAGGEFGGPPEGSQESSVPGSKPASEFTAQGPTQSGKPLENEEPPAAEAAKNAKPAGKATWKKNINPDGSDSGTGYWTRPATYVNPDDREEGTAPGENAPINVNRRGVNRLEGNATAPAGTSADDKTLAQQQHPNNPQAQAQSYEQQRTAQAERENKVEVAKNSGVARAQALGQSRENVANIHKQGVEYAADKALAAKTYLANNPSADGRVIQSQVKMLDDFVKANPGATQDQQDQYLIRRGANPRIFNISPRGGQQAPQQAAPAAPAPAAAAPTAQVPPAPEPGQREANTVYQTPKGPLKWTGTGWVSP